MLVELRLDRSTAVEKYSGCDRVWSGVGRNVIEFSRVEIASSRVALAQQSRNSRNSREKDDS